MSVDNAVAPSDPSAPIDSIDLTADDRARVDAEVRRIFRTSAWVGPIGSSTLSAIIALLLWNEVPNGRLTAWLMLIGLGVLGQVLAVVVPAIRGWEGGSGLPRLTYVAHGILGVGYGGLLWLDSAMVERADLRWLGVMALFAMSAGVASGLNGLNMLAMCVLGPMWTIGPLALLADGRWLVGLGGLAFLAIQIVDQRRSGELWRELIQLRIEQERRTEQQRWIAQHDDLTGLLNRAGVIASLRQVEGRAASAMYVDLDHFKQVNDELGHAAGDEVLIAVAERLRVAVRDDDAVGRLGGDEFFVVFRRPLRSDRVEILGQQIIASIERPIDTGSGRASVSVSIGVATVDGRIHGGEVLMSHADHALLRAKRRGRHRIEMFDG